MIVSIISTKSPVTLVGGGVIGATDLQEATHLAPTLVAADGGAVPAISAGLLPQAVIGDFDSLPATLRAQLPDETLHHIEEQDSTDFEKALRRISAPLVLAVGFTGARIDHELATFHGLLSCADRPCLVIGEREIIFHCPPRLRLDMALDEIVSLFPLRAVTGRSTGLHWPIEGLNFAPGACIGTSNRALGGPMELCMDQPGMLVLLPRAMLGAVTKALLDCAPEHGRWPAP